MCLLVTAALPPSCVQEELKREQEDLQNKLQGIRDSPHQPTAPSHGKQLSWRFVHNIPNAIRVTAWELDLCVCVCVCVCVIPLADLGAP